MKQLKTIAGILLRELQRKLPIFILEQESENFYLYEHGLKQKREDKNKIYSLHEPHIYCMAKGKLDKRYEFSTKASIVKTQGSNIVLGALAFEKNEYDGHTLSAVLAQVKKLSNLIPESAWVDRGYRGQSRVDQTNIHYPKPLSKNTSKEMLRYLRKQFRRRAGIEAIIGHLISDHRLDRNFLKGFLGDQIKLLMAGAAFNFKKWMRALLFWLRFYWAIDSVDIGFCQANH